MNTDRRDTDRRTVQKTAAEAYSERFTHIGDQLNLICKALQDHTVKAGKEPLNWGFVGDLSAAESHLSHALRLLGGEEG